MLWAPSLCTVLVKRQVLSRLLITRLLVRVQSFSNLTPLKSRPSVMPLPAKQTCSPQAAPQLHRPCRVGDAHLSKTRQVALFGRVSPFGGLSNGRVVDQLALEVAARARMAAAEITPSGAAPMPIRQGPVPAKPQAMAARTSPSEMG